MKALLYRLVKLFRDEFTKDKEVSQSQSLKTGECLYQKGRDIGTKREYTHGEILQSSVGWLHGDGVRGVNIVNKFLALGRSTLNSLRRLTLRENG